MKETEEHSIDTEAMPDHAVKEFCRVVFRNVREYFSQPGVREDYERWLAERRKEHPEEGEA